MTGREALGVECQGDGGSCPEVFTITETNSDTPTDTSDFDCGGRCK